MKQLAEPTYSLLLESPFGNIYRRNANPLVSNDYDDYLLTRSKPRRGTSYHLSGEWTMKQLTDRCITENFVEQYSFIPENRG